MVLVKHAKIAHQNSQDLVPVAVGNALIVPPILLVKATLVFQLRVLDPLSAPQTLIHVQLLLAQDTFAGTENVEKLIRAVIHHPRPIICVTTAMVVEAVLHIKDLALAATLMLGFVVARGAVSMGNVVIPLRQHLVIL